MDILKQLLEYEEMYKDGVISEAECQKLKDMIRSTKMAELGLQSEDELNDYINREVFRESVLMLENNTVASYKEAITWLEKLGDWGNAKAVIDQCRAELPELEAQEALAEAERAKKEIYDNAIIKLKKQTLASHNEAIKDLESLGDWEDAKDIIEKSKKELSVLEEKVAKEKQELEKKRQKTKKTITIAIIIVACIVALYLVNENVIKPNKQYKAAIELYEQGKYDEAISAFQALEGFKDSEEQIQICKDAKSEEIYVKAKNLYNSGSYDQALKLFESISAYKDSKTQIQLCKDAINEGIYQQALALLEDKKYEEAIAEFEKIRTYKDSSDQINKATEVLNSKKYSDAKALLDDGKYGEASKLFTALGSYKDSKKYIEYCNLAEFVNGNLEGENLSDLMSSIHELNNFNNADDLITDNKYLSQIESWEGSWINSEGEMDAKNMYHTSYRIDNNGIVYTWSGPKKWVHEHEYGYFTVDDGKLRIHNEYGRLEKISVSGNTMTVDDDGFIDTLIRQ